MNDLDLHLEVVLRSCQPCSTFDVEYLGNCRLGSKGPPIGNGIFKWSRDRCIAWPPKVLWGSTVSYPSDSWTSCPTIFPKRLGIFTHLLYFLSTLDYKFLFSYFQLWRSYAIVSANTQRIFLHFTRTLTSKFANWANNITVDVMSYPTCLPNPWIVGSFRRHLTAISYIPFNWHGGHRIRDLYTICNVAKKLSSEQNDAC